MKLIPQALAQTERAPAPTPDAPVPAPAATAPETAAPAPAPAAPGAPAAAPQTKTQTGQATPPRDPNAQAPSLPDLFAQLVPIFVILAITYFIVMRPRQRAEKEKLAALKNVRRGDTLVTSSGIIAKVTKAIDDAEIEVEIAPNVRIRLLRSAVVEVRAKGEPVKDQPAPTK